MQMPATITKVYDFFAKRRIHSASVRECPIGCDANRIEIALCKPSRKSKGAFVPVYYRKKRRRISQQTSGVTT